MSERSHASVDHVTELLHSMERDVADLRQELDHSQRLSLVGTLAAGVAHEVNNLLTPARGYAQMLQGGEVDEAMQKKAAGRVADAIDAASRVLEAILDFSSFGADDARADVDDVLRSAVDCLGGNLARDGIRLTQSIPPGTLVTMAPIALQQVLLNLLLNARTALSDRGGALTITARERGDGRTEITVDDDGPGIPAAIADTVFEPFVSGAARRDPNDGRGGSGLGLAVCRRIIETAHGTIKVTSKPGAGTSFAITLPTAPREPRAKAG